MTIIKYNNDINNEYWFMKKLENIHKQYILKVMNNTSEQ